MDIVYHAQDMVGTPSGSFVEKDCQGGVTVSVAEEKITQHMSDNPEVDLAFCLTFLDYRAAFKRYPDGSVQLIACIPEWKKEVKATPIDPECYLLKHGAVQSSSIDPVDITNWIAQTFSDPKTKLGIISGPNRQIVIALMRDKDDLVTIANDG